MVPSLAYAPPERLDEFVLVVEKNINDDLLPLLKWFEKNYIGERHGIGQSRNILSTIFLSVKSNNLFSSFITSSIGRQRLQPLFPIPSWNLFHRVLDGDDQTNNYAEAAHLSLSKHFSSDHPKIWKFLDGLQKIQVCTNKIIYTEVSFTSSVHLIFCCFCPLRAFMISITSNLLETEISNHKDDTSINQKSRK